jgi:hypothetical protein
MGGMSGACQIRLTNDPRARVVGVRLCHRTDQRGRDGIEAVGFRQLDPLDGPGWSSPKRGRVWFAISKEVARQTCWRSGWWVWTDVPDDTPEHLLTDGEHYRGNYSLSIDYVNGLELEFEQGD